MEAASIKRGRPVLEPEMRAFVAGQFPEVSSAHGQRDIIARIHAMGVLDTAPECLWVLDRPRLRLGARAAWQPSILTELGRMLESGHWTEAEVVEQAQRLSRERPRAKLAVAELRRMRVRRRDKGVVAAVILLQWMEDTPGATWNDALVANAPWVRLPAVD